MERHLSEHMQTHLNVQLKLEVIKERQQFILDKWRRIQNDGVKQKAKMQLAQKTAAAQRAKRTERNQPSEEKLLRELKCEYKVLKQQVESQYQDILQHFKSRIEADTAFRLQQQLQSLTSELQTITTSKKRQELELRRQKTDFSKAENSKKSHEYEHANLMIDLEKITAMNSKTEESLEMFKEDIRSLGCPTLELSSEWELGTKISQEKAAMRELSLCIKNTKRAQDEATCRLQSISEKMIHAQNKLNEIDKKLVSKRTQTKKYANESAQYRDVLNRDRFATTDLSMRTGSDLSCVAGDDDTRSPPPSPSPQLSQQEHLTIAQSSDDDQVAQKVQKKTERPVEVVGAAALDMKQLLDTERRLASSELPLQTQLLEATDIAQLSVYQTLLALCAHWHQTYHRLLKQALSLRTELNELSEDRFNTLLKALDQINTELDPLYSEIVPLGSCYLDYPRDKVSLFEGEALKKFNRREGGEGKFTKSGGGGIRLRARHHGGDCTFREVQSLSGGQTAAVGFALLMSLQHCYPSPFVIMDEVDAALDTSTSFRVGRLIRKRSHSISACCNAQHSCRSEGGRVPGSSPQQEEMGSQFAVVSHRPEMQVWADAIVGVYISHDFPDAVSVCFDSAMDNGVDS
jgi:chromosome segregation ATPase